MRRAVVSRPLRYRGKHRQARGAALPLRVCTLLVRDRTHAAYFLEPGSRCKRLTQGSALADAFAHPVRGRLHLFKEDFYALPSIAAYCAREDHFPRRCWA